MDGRRCCVLGFGAGGWFLAGEGGVLRGGLVDLGRF